MEQPRTLAHLHERVATLSVRLDALQKALQGIKNMIDNVDLACKTEFISVEAAHIYLDLMPCQFDKFTTLNLDTAQIQDIHMQMIRLYRKFWKENFMQQKSEKHSECLPVTIDITPTPEGCRTMKRLFQESIVSYEAQLPRARGKKKEEIEESIRALREGIDELTAKGY